jgi:ABC-2 type transport system ATP-binding protein
VSVRPLRAERTVRPDRESELGVTLEALGLTKRFGDRTAVDGLSFTVPQGEVVGLLGPNGAGKTTTIRLLTTVLAPTSGEFAVAGIASDRPTLIRERVGVLPESAGYPGHQTALDYLRYHARLFGLSRADAARLAERLLTEVGLEARASSRISKFSRGMRQRLGLARTLVNDPAVVFLDEPTLGLDPAGQRQVLGMVRDIAQRRGATVVLSTHTLPDVEEVCTSVMILDRGQIVVSGTVREVTSVVAAPRSGQLRVPFELVGQAKDALARVPGIALDLTDERPDVIRISLTVPPGAGSGDEEAGLNAAVRAVLAAGVPILAFEVEGARLSDAFFTMTRNGIP